jgi:hypothetical protein
LLWRERIGKHGAEEAEKKYAEWDKLTQQLYEAKISQYSDPDASDPNQSRP